MTGLSVPRVVEVEGLCLWGRSASRRARASPFIIAKGYLLSVEEVVRAGFGVLEVITGVDSSVKCQVGCQCRVVPAALVKVDEV